MEKKITRIVIVGGGSAGWLTGDSNDFFYHPFMTPDGYGHLDLHAAWQANQLQHSFADTINIQSHICQAGLAPKQFSTPQYAAVSNYGYHLDAVKFSKLLQQHCTTKLNVKHIIGHVGEIISAENGDISAIVTKEQGAISGDLFIDCTGSTSLLLGQHFDIPFISKKHILFNDSALAVQVPHSQHDSPIESATLSTAQSAGWIWDIGLPTRRGIGYTYSSAHISDQQAQLELTNYLAKSIGEHQAAQLIPRKLTFNPGHRAKFWHRNCVAVGMSAGFLEPLEASALALIELAATMISEQLPVNRAHMDLVAERFNQRFEYRWQRVIEFLKLHYVLSRRQDHSYWQDNKARQSIPPRLQKLLELWRYQPPSRYDLIQNEEIFPSASYQYILYGMRFNTQTSGTPSSFNNQQRAAKIFSDNQLKTQQCLAGLPSNRELLDHLTKELTP